MQIDEVDFVMVEEDVDQPIGDGVGSKPYRVDAQGFKRAIVPAANAPRRGHKNELGVQSVRTLAEALNGV